MLLWHFQENIYHFVKRPLQKYPPQQYIMELFLGELVDYSCQFQPNIPVPINFYISIISSTLGPQ